MLINQKIIEKRDAEDMKHYIEIQKVRETDVTVDDTLTLPKNTDAFKTGDIISCKRQVLFHKFWQLFFHNYRHFIFHTF